jgi:hypothetical protein
MEEWQSGLMHRFTKPETLNWVRGFESYFFRLVDYSSGQRGQTVNLLAIAFGSSNLSSTIGG